MPKKKEPSLSPEEQKKRFEAMAREVGASASSKQFKETLWRLLTPKGSSKHEKNKAK